MASRRRIASLSLGLLLCGVAAAVADPAPASNRPGVDERLLALVGSELRALDATHADDLVEGAPHRPLTAASAFPLEHGDGRARFVVIGLAPGPPGDLPVPTEMEYLRFLVGEDDQGRLTVGERPERGDLATAVTRVLADEARAFAAASAALVKAGVALPEGLPSWREALRSATYDARLPRARFPGEPGWQFIFEPWTERGWNGVLLRGDLTVTSVNGRPP